MRHARTRRTARLFGACGDFVADRFGTLRGLVRTVLANLMYGVGPYRKYANVDWSRVDRLVFVCQGNICRSPFAHHLAGKLLGGGLRVSSFGLSTTTGIEAFELASRTAAEFSVDLSEHRTTDLTDFELRDGDLYVVMEDRHVRQLRPALHDADSQICLLGLWCRPRFALLYDPHRLSERYFRTCFERIDEAVRRLVSDAGAP